MIGAPRHTSAVNSVEELVTPCYFAQTQFNLACDRDVATNCTSAPSLDVFSIEDSDHFGRPVGPGLLRRIDCAASDPVIRVIFRINTPDTIETGASTFRPPARYGRSAVFVMCAILRRRRTATRMLP
jgi:hypothetical protein